MPVPEDSLLGWHTNQDFVLIHCVEDRWSDSVPNIVRYNIYATVLQQVQGYVSFYFPFTFRSALTLNMERHIPVFPMCSPKQTAIVECFCVNFNLNLGKRANCNVQATNLGEKRQMSTVWRVPTFSKKNNPVRIYKLKFIVIQV